MSSKRNTTWIDLLLSSPPDTNELFLFSRSQAAWTQLLVFPAVQGRIEYLSCQARQYLRYGELHNDLCTQECIVFCVGLTGIIIDNCLSGMDN
jgi:hypothetical protein